MRTAVRAFLIWLAIMSLEVLQGVLRTLLLAPEVGDFRARQIGVFTGSIMIVTVAYWSIGWIGVKGHRSLFSMGLAWLALTISFELLFGRLALDASWETLAADYKIWQGGLLPIGLVVLTLSPLIAARLRGLDPA